MTDQLVPVNERDLDWDEETHGETFANRKKSIGRAAGGERLGCGLYEIPPGRRSMPYHYHTANEEAIYVLDGTGEIRTPTGDVSVTAGDYVTFPVGEDGAHQVHNPTGEPLRYLCMSTMQEPDVSVYPDSGNVLIMAGAASGGPPEAVTLRKHLDGDAEVDYWDGAE